MMERLRRGAGDPTLCNDDQSAHVMNTPCGNDVTHLAGGERCGADRLFAIRPVPYKEFVMTHHARRRSSSFAAIGIVVAIITLSPIGLAPVRAQTADKPPVHLTTPALPNTDVHGQPDFDFD